MAGEPTAGSLLNPPNVSALERSRSYGTTLPPSLGSYRRDFDYAAPSPLSADVAYPRVNPLSPSTQYPWVSCRAGVCFGSDGTQYAPGTGNVMFGSNGKVCQYTAPGAPL